MSIRAHARQAVVISAILPVTAAACVALRIAHQSYQAGLPFSAARLGWPCGASGEQARLRCACARVAKEGAGAAPLRNEKLRSVFTWYL